MTKEYVHKAKLTIIILIIMVILAEVSAIILSISYAMGNVFLFVSSIIIFIIVLLVDFSVLRKQFLAFDKRLTSLLHNLKIKELIIELNIISESTLLYRIYILKHHLLLLDIYSITKQEDQFKETFSSVNNLLEHKYKTSNPVTKYTRYRLSTTSFQFAVVMKYVDNLIEWGDTLFEQYDMESVSQYHPGESSSLWEIKRYLYFYYKSRDIDIDKIEKKYVKNIFEEYLKYCIVLNYYLNIGDKKNAKRVREIISNWDIKA